MAAVWSSTKLLEFDFCVSPQSKILRSDLSWVDAEHLTVGEELIGFDEAMGVGHSHSFRASTVLGVRKVVLPRVKVVTTHGETIVAANHKFAARQIKYRREWIEARNLRPGARMAFLAAPWEFDESRDAGYLAGFFDGEGWIGKVTVGYGQNPGPVLAHVQHLLRARGFEFYETMNSSNAHCEISNGIRETLRFLGMIRPSRLMRKSRQIWENRRTWGKQSPVVEVISVEPLLDDVCIAIETTTKTYISDGFFSHNCGIEAVLLGWFMKDPSYVRLGKLGMHAYLSSHVLGRPANLKWPDEQLGQYFAEIKSAKDTETRRTYDGCKRVVHGNGYGQTVMGTYLANQKLFPGGVAQTQRLCETYYSIAPKLPKFHGAVRRTAHESHYLGGADAYWYDEVKQKVGGHPYQYKLWFWSVIAYQRLNPSQVAWRTKRRMPMEEINGITYGIQLGEDAKKVVAYYPQSTARGVLTEACFPLFDPEEELAARCYIGDFYYGETPLRAPIHDSLLLECPTRKVDQLIERVAYSMQRPVDALPLPPEWAMGPYLTIGVDAKIGSDWGSMEKLSLPSWQEIGVSGDVPYTPADEEDEELVEELEIRIA